MNMNRLYMGVYPKGYIYYGEMDNEEYLIVAYCKNCTKRTFMSEIYVSNHVYKIEY